MATTMILPTMHTTLGILQNATAKLNLSRKRTQYFEFYVPTSVLSQTSHQHLMTTYYLPTQRENRSHKTSDIFYDRSYYYENQWF